MIATLHGEVVQIEDDALIIAVGGVGLRVYVPLAVSKAAETGKKTFLYTHLVVREDALTLFGFESLEEREFFNLLLSVNGVGPRTALNILSTLSVDVIRHAVLAEQPDVFGRVTGVGKKTGQKIILSLQGKVGAAVGPAVGLELDIDADVIEALTSVGYSVVEAQAAIQSLPKDAPRDLEGRLRMALQYFST